MAQLQILNNSKIFIWINSKLKYLRILFGKRIALIIILINNRFFIMLFLNLYTNQTNINNIITI